MTTKKITVRTVHELERLEEAGMYQPTEWERLAIQLIEANTAITAIRLKLNKPWWKRLFQ